MMCLFIDCVCVYGNGVDYTLFDRDSLNLLHMLELGYNVMYNDVDMVWLDDPFWYLEGNQDVTVEVASYPHLVGLLHH